MQAAFATNSLKLDLGIDSSQPKDYPPPSLLKKGRDVNAESAPSATFTSGGIVHKRMFEFDNLPQDKELELGDMKRTASSFLINQKRKMVPKLQPQSPDGWEKFPDLQQSDVAGGRKKRFGFAGKSSKHLRSHVLDGSRRDAEHSCVWGTFETVKSEK